MRRLIGCARGNWAGRYAGILAVLATLLAAAPASASSRLSPVARRDLGKSGGVSYPAAYAISLDAGAPEVASLDSALRNSGLGRALARQCPIGTDSSVQGLIRRPHQWSAVRLPPPIAKILKGTPTYLLFSASTGPVTPGSGPYWRIREIVALRRGRLYSLPDNLVYLLEDCGFGFRREDVKTWAPVVAYLISSACGGSTSSNQASWDRGLDSVARGYGPLFPAVTIRETAMDTAKTMSFGQSILPGDIQELRVVMTVDGATDTAIIATTRGPRGLYPNQVWWRGVQVVNRPLLSVQNSGDTIRDY